MKSNFFEVIDFPFFNTKNGLLAMFQGGDVKADKKLPFAIKRVLVIKDMQAQDVRGGHTHHKTRQMLFAINGSCQVNMDNGKQKESIKLETFNQGVLLEPYVWHTMSDFTPGTILLVLADTEYDESEYIRNYDDFLGYVKKI